MREVAMREKAKKFIRNYYKENGVMPSADDVNDAKQLTQSDIEKLDFQLQVITLVDNSGKEYEAVWDYVYDKDSWNAAYNKENSPLKTYLDLYPDEDLWSTSLNRAAGFNDRVYAAILCSDSQGETEVREANLKAGWVNSNVQKLTDIDNNTVYYTAKDVKEGEDVYELFSDNELSNSANLFVKFVSHSYPGFVHCWEGAINANAANYPWCVVNIEPFIGNIKFNYDGGEDVYPWGVSDRTFKRNFAIASIPGELGSEFALNNGTTTFDPSKLVVTIIRN